MYGRRNIWQDDVGDQGYHCFTTKPYSSKVLSSSYTNKYNCECNVVKAIVCMFFQIQTCLPRILASEYVSLSHIMDLVNSALPNFKRKLRLLTLQVRTVKNN